MSYVITITVEDIDDIPNIVSEVVRLINLERLAINMIMKERERMDGEISESYVNENQIYIKDM